MAKFHGYTIPASLWSGIVAQLLAAGFVLQAGCNVREAIVSAANKVGSVPSGFDGFKYPDKRELQTGFYPAWKAAQGTTASGKTRKTAAGTTKSASAASPVTTGWKHPETGKMYTGRGWQMVRSNYLKRHAAAEAVTTAAQAHSDPRDTAQHNVSMDAAILENIVSVLQKLDRRLSKLEK